MLSALLKASQGRPHLLGRDESTRDIPDRDLPKRRHPPGAQVLRMHLLDNLRQRIEAGHKDFLNELRACTVVFVGLPSLQDHRPGAAAEGPASVQAAVDIVQRRLAAAGGSLLQVRLASGSGLPYTLRTAPRPVSPGFVLCPLYRAASPGCRSRGRLPATCPLCIAPHPVPLPSSFLRPFQTPELPSSSRSCELSGLNMPASEVHVKL